MVDHKEETLADQVLLMITFAVACMDSRSFEFCRGGRSECLIVQTLRFRKTIAALLSFFVFGL
jgi:hypothetical protein